jgi:hypothetical protein
MDDLMSSDSDFSSGSSSDQEMFQEMEEEILLITQLAAILEATSTLFNTNEMQDQSTVNHDEPVRDVLATMRSTPSLFKSLTNFSIEEFDELAALVCPTLVANARTTGEAHLKQGRPFKLRPEQRLLNFILYMRHDNITIYDAYMWNWCRSSVCDDTIFVASCINEVLASEIRWPSAEERRALGEMVPQFTGCIGLIDGTLCKIRRPKIEEHKTFFNGRKKMYCLNSTVIVDHHGLFIHVDPGFPGSAHDVSILRMSPIHQRWREHFTHTDQYFEYLLGDPGYIGTEQYIMRRLGRTELHENVDSPAIDAYNKMHAGFRIKVEWGIGGLKRKWRRLMK